MPGFFSTRVFLKIEDPVAEDPEELALEGLGVEIGHHQLSGTILHGKFSWRYLVRDKKKADVDVASSLPA
eukprot:7476151-Ditylum_brightwellii.AAC.1